MPSNWGHTVYTSSTRTEVKVVSRALEWLAAKLSVPHVSTWPLTLRHSSLTSGLTSFCTAGFLTNQPKASGTLGLVLSHRN